MSLVLLEKVRRYVSSIVMDGGSQTESFSLGVWILDSTVIVKRTYELPSGRVPVLAV